MKTYKSLLAATVLGLSLSSCTSLLDVNNPNYFTDDEMAEFIGGSEEAEQQVLTGLVGSLPGYINIYNAAIAGGYSNASAYESNFEFRRFCQSGDVVEGDRLNQGTYSTWYQNLANNTYWRTDQEIQNYGYYLAPVLKLGPALKALDFLTEERVEKYPRMGSSRAQALTMKAICYMMLMERYTDLQDVTSTTKQGWPIYDAYTYNAAKAPLSVAETWNWINTTLKEAVDLFHDSTLGEKGYTIGNEAAQIYDIDCAVAQYYRCRAALDSKDWKTVIEAGNDLLSHFPNLINADDYGMKASLLASVNSRAGVTASLPQGTSWNGSDFNATQNAFYNLEKNPEAIFGSARGSSNIFWTNAGLNALKRSPSGYYQVDKGIYDALSDNDCRKACILPEDFEDFHVYTNNGADTTWYQYTMPKYTSLKWAASSAIGYKNHTNEATTSDNIYLRSSAVLLMVAEAYAQGGQDAQARALLDKLLAARTKSGATAMTCDNTMPGKSVMEMVKLQWRIEMWGEGDWAFFNQKRWGVQNARGANHWSETQIPAEGFTWEIPQKERQGNPYWN